MSQSILIGQRDDGDKSFFEFGVSIDTWYLEKLKRERLSEVDDLGCLEIKVDEDNDEEETQFTDGLD